MNRVKCLMAMSLITLVAGCATQAPQPIVSAFNGDSVEIQIENNALSSTPEQMEEARAETQRIAEEICNRGPNKKAEYVSTRTMPTTNAFIAYETHLFLCLQ